MVVAKKSRAIRDTALALLVRLDNGDERWIPKSAVHDDSSVFEVGHAGELVVARWFARKEKLA